MSDLLEAADAEFFALRQEATDMIEMERMCIIRVQAVFRGTKVRRRWHVVLDVTLFIQRVARGWLARRRCRVFRAQRSQRLNQIFFDTCAAVIQRHFRGWNSRRYTFDFYSRKAYLDKVAKRGEWTKEYLRRYETNLIIESKLKEEEHMRSEFQTLAGELHHLISTKSIPGVYNPPYNDVLPRAFEKPIEQHLRDECKLRIPRIVRRPRRFANVRPAGEEEQGVPSPPMTERIIRPPQDPLGAPHSARTPRKIMGPFRSPQQVEVANAKASTIFRSLQADSPYDAVEVQQKKDTALSKLSRVSPTDFKPPAAKPPAPPPPSSVHSGAPYSEKPAEMRSEYTTLPKIQDKPPFFTAVPYNKPFYDYAEQEYLPAGAV